MAQELDLDFKEPPRVVSVPTNHFIRFCSVCQERNIGILIAFPKPGYYKLTLSAPIQDDMVEMTIPDE